MFGLFKLLAYGLLGYALYEFIRGMNSTQGVGQGGGGALGFASSGGGSQGNLNRAPERANLTGPGKGRSVATQDAGGGSSQHRVGRGVVTP